MEFYCLGSGSSGNAYIFKNANEYILVECGFEYKKLCNKILALGILPTEIKAVVCTHHHADHIGSLESWVKLGVKSVAPADCFIEKYSNVCCAKDGDKLDLTENISLLAFSVKHDCDALGYILYFKNTKESVLFINDTYYFDFQYKTFGYDYIFIECNHIRNKLDEIIVQKLTDDNYISKYERQAKYHMSLAALKKFLGEINLSKTKAVYLMHQSKECCDGKLCQDIISNTFKVKTYVCGEKGGFIE